MNYRYFLFGSPDDTSHWNDTHLYAFWITIFVSFVITIVNFAICYPLAYYPRAGRAARSIGDGGLMLMLVVPYWINEILRAFAFRVMFGTGGSHQRQAIDWRLGLIREPVDFIGADVALYAGLTYAYRVDHDVSTLQCAGVARPQSGRGGPRSGSAVVAHTSPRS